MIVFTDGSPEQAAYDRIQTIRKDRLAVDDEALRELIEEVVTAATPVVRSGFDELRDKYEHAKSYADGLEAKIARTRKALDS